MPDIEKYARLLHNVHEDLARAYGCEPQARSRVLYDDLPDANKTTTRDAAAVILAVHRADVLRQTSDLIVNGTDPVMRSIVDRQSRRIIAERLQVLAAEVVADA